jgi:SNF2 family DNA or RNA helicase
MEYTESVHGLSRGLDMADPIKNFVIPAAKPPASLATSLEEQERQLTEQLEAIRKKRAEEAERERKLALVRPVAVTVTGLAGSMVVVHAEFREDLLQLWKSVPDRAYRGSMENAIPLIEWARTVSKLLALPNITVQYVEGVEEIIRMHLSTPVWMIEIKNKRFRITPSLKYNSYDVLKVLGCEWEGYKNPANKYFTAPLSEGWSLFEALKDVEGTMWTDEARDFTLKQVEGRATLDQIGSAEEWLYDAGFVGINPSTDKPYVLRPFQGVGCAFIEATGGRALLAYEMGLGKTPMSLAYAWKNKLKTIIICPASLKANWCRQVFKFTGVRPNVLVGAEPTNHDIVSLITSPNIFTIINYDLLGRVTKYDDIVKDKEGYDHVEHRERYLWIEAINMSKPDLVICDESHYIKNTDSNRSQAVRQLKTPRILHMTGTPVLNRPGELWPLLTMIAPETFPSEELFIAQYTIDGKRAKNVDKLKATLKNIMIRRKQSDVRKNMPPLNRITEYHELGSKARKLYMKVLAGVYERVEAYSSRGQHGGEESVTNILVQIQRLKQICAIDKVDRTAELATELHESAGEERYNKVLIFSQFKACAYAITQRLGHEAIGFVSRGSKDFITANDAERDRLVQQFQNDPSVKYLVVTEKTAKEGHDITEAGFVIFNDLFWTPANHEQGEGRAFMRESDPHGITSYYIITDKEGGTEIEEWIWELLKMKEDVILQTVEGVEASRDSSVAMALIEKIKESMWTRKR